MVFFLGSIVPLALLAFLAHRYVLPLLSRGARATEIGTTAAILLVAVLSFLAYVSLSRVSDETVQVFKKQNQRLQILFETASALADTAHSDIVMAKALESAMGLTGASIGYAFPLNIRGEIEAPLTRGHAASSMLEREGEALRRLVRRAGEEKRPIVLGRRGDGVTSFASSDRRDIESVLATPLAAHGQSFGAFILIHDRAPFFPEDVSIIATLADQTAIALHNAGLQETQKNFFTHVTEIVVQGLDSYLDYQTGHSKRVARYSHMMGRELGLEGRRLERLYFAALLHDIGMLKVEKGTTDRTDYQRHPVLGADMIVPITLWSDLAPIVLHHHEWYDGGGYPEGRKGEEIPFESRIIGLAEAYDSMTHQTTYRDRLSQEQALAELKRCAGAQFDPRVVEAFVSLHAAGAIEA